MSLSHALSALVLPRIGGREFSGSGIELEAIVSARKKLLGLTSDGAYLEHVRTRLDDELPHLAGAFTNGWTWFFRDAGPLEALAERLSEETASRDAKGRIARVWVAGCSTGEEAYSVVLACLVRGVEVAVLGTDVDGERLAHARAATYAAGALRRISPALLERYFEPVEGQRARLRAEVRRRVELRAHNLMDPPLASPDGAPWDAIVCRNVLLHLSDDAAARVQRELALTRPRALLLAPADRLPVVLQRETPLALSRPVRPSIEEAKRDPFRDIGVHIRAGAHHEARRALEALTQQHGAEATAHLALGNLALHAHDLPRAAAAYARAEQIMPGSPELHFLWGTLHRRTGALGDAATSLRRALFLDADLWPAWFLLAGALERSGLAADAARARRETERALDRRDRVRWVSFVDDLEGVACPRALVADAIARRAAI